MVIPDPSGGSCAGRRINRSYFSPKILYSVCRPVYDRIVPENSLSLNLPGRYDINWSKRYGQKELFAAFSCKTENAQQMRQSMKGVLPMNNDFLNWLGNNWHWVIIAVAALILIAV